MKLTNDDRADVRPVRTRIKRIYVSNYFEQNDLLSTVCQMISLDVTKNVTNMSLKLAAWQCQNPHEAREKIILILKP